MDAQDSGPTLMFMSSGDSPRHASPRRREFTVRQYAEREQVDDRTVRRWITKGAVDVRRTPGGGIRIVENQR